MHKGYKKSGTVPTKCTAPFFTFYSANKATKVSIGTFFGAKIMLISESNKHFFDIFYPSSFCYCF